LYFRAVTDTAGRKLQGNCTYVVRGADLPARWWNITMYNTDHYLIRNPQNRYSYASVNVAREGGGDFRITVAPEADKANWLNIASVPNFVLLARLYQPAPGAAGNPSSIAMPVKERVRCR
jgi:hypothetical protein